MYKTKNHFTVYTQINYAYYLLSIPLDADFKHVSNIVL